MTVADRAVAAGSSFRMGEMVVAEVLRQAAGQAGIRFEQRQHRMQTFDLGPLAGLAFRQQLVGQGLDVERGLAHLVDIGHALAFQHHPALVLKVLQRRDDARARGIDPRIHAGAVETLEIHRTPGLGDGDVVHQQAHEVGPFPLEACDQIAGLLEIAQPVFGQIGEAGRDHAVHLETHQQCLQRQQADIAVAGERIEQHRPLALRLAAGLGDLGQHVTNALALRRVAIDEVLQHAQTVATGQHQAA